jgi:hypothetical protein
MVLSKNSKLIVSYRMVFKFKKKKDFLALNFRLAINMLQLIYALEKPSQPRISFERAIKSFSCQCSLKSLWVENSTFFNERIMMAIIPEDENCHTSRRRVFGRLNFDSDR